MYMCLSILAGIQALLQKILYVIMHSLTTYGVFSLQNIGIRQNGLIK
jgi:hypothetical protein